MIYTYVDGSAHSVVGIKCPSQCIGCSFITSNKYSHNLISYLFTRHFSIRRKCTVYRPAVIHSETMKQQRQVQAQQQPFQLSYPDRLSLQYHFQALSGSAIITLTVFVIRELIDTNEKVAIYRSLQETNVFSHRGRPVDCTAILNSLS